MSSGCFVLGDCEMILRSRFLIENYIFMDFSYLSYKWEMSRWEAPGNPDLIKIYSHDSRRLIIIPTRNKSSGCVFFTGMVVVHIQIVEIYIII